MATITQQKARVAYTLSGNSPKVLAFAEGISQTFKRGALLQLTASGTVKVMVNRTGTGFDTVRKRILGLALDDAAQNATSPTTTRNIKVHIANADSVFISNAISTTSDATATLALLDIGKAGGASVNSSRCYFDRTAIATATTLRCLGLVDEISDKYGRVLWQVLPAARLF